MSSSSLAKNYNFFSLLRYAAPTIIMMIFMSMYTIVDGIFVSRLVGTDALSAINIVFPVITVGMAISIMFATGGTAIIAKKMGEQKQEEANRNLSLILIVSFAASVILAAVCLIFLEPVCRMLGADGILMPYATDYLKVLLIFMPVSTLQISFEIFFVAAGKPSLGLILTIASGITNIVLDYLFIAVFNVGIAGAAYATSAGYIIPAAAGIIFFFVKKDGLKFGIPKFDGKMLFKACCNGSSEMITNLSNSVVTFLFNIYMMKYLGKDGVAAITIVLYSQFLLSAFFTGYSMGVAPVISYNYGAENFRQLKKTSNICIIFIPVVSVITTLIAYLLAPYITLIFTPTTSSVYDIALHGFYIFCSSFIFMGINIYASSFFTALSNGLISGVISILRTLIFLVICITCLPLVIGADGLWAAVPIAEGLTLIFSAIFFILFKKKYKY